MLELFQKPRWLGSWHTISSKWDVCATVWYTSSLQFKSSWWNIRNIQDRSSPPPKNSNKNGSKDKKKANQDSCITQIISPNIKFHKTSWKSEENQKSQKPERNNYNQNHNSSIQNKTIDSQPPLTRPPYTTLQPSFKFISKKASHEIIIRRL